MYNTPVNCRLKSKLPELQVLAGGTQPRAGILRKKYFSVSKNVVAGLNVSALEKVFGCSCTFASSAEPISKRFPSPALRSFWISFTVMVGDY